MAKPKQPAETIEEVIKSIERACEIAQSLVQSQPLSSIEEMVTTLSGAKEKLVVFQQDQTCSFADQMDDATPTSLEEYAETIDRLFQMQQGPCDVGANYLLQTEMIGGGTSSLHIGGRDVQDFERSNGLEASHSRPRRSNKKFELEKTMKMVPAPEFGNIEQPPEDGYSWRKYGQKEILGSKYPRSYYRCTHQKLYECVAKKQVQRVDHNPNMFRVIYRGKHTCHVSSTSQDNMATTAQSTAAENSGRWLPTMNLSLQVGGADGGDYPVVDMADVMFNSGSSSGNSMESLFPPQY